MYPTSIQVFASALFATIVAAGLNINANLLHHTLLSCCVQQTTELQLNLRIAQQFQWILEKALSR
jgi:hypothetical protein